MVQVLKRKKVLLTENNTVTTDSMFSIPTPPVEEIRAAKETGAAYLQSAQWDVALPNTLTEDERELWEERAAIREYDGGATREQAEVEAYFDIVGARELDELGSMMKEFGLTEDLSGALTWPVK